jgi:Na+/H+ antiporter NhaD/arsenite permease-like protein
MLIHQIVLVVFALVYAGMILGRLPRLQLDRTGVALLGAIVLIAAGAVSLEQAITSIDIPTITLLFGLMIVSAQLRLGGFYTRVSAAVTAGETSPPMLLAALIGTVAVLSAVFSNDIVCLAVPPVVIHSCRRRGLDPVPFLLGTACGANVGSAATLIGNPQNMLIGETLGLSFSRFLAVAAVPTLAGLAVVWAVISWQQHRRWALTGEISEPEYEEPAEYNRWQTAKGLGVAGALLVLFLLTDLPREVLALTAAGILLMSRRLHSRNMLGLVDWQLLVLFGGLFVVNGAFQHEGFAALAVERLGAWGVEVTHPAPLFVVSAALSNLVSNVPAVMLLLQFARNAELGPVLALSSTLAGNLTIVGSIANIIVVDIAARHGIAIDWRRHARTGVPVTLATLAIAGGWLYFV